MPTNVLNHSWMTRGMVRVFLRNVLGHEPSAAVLQDMCDHWTEIERWLLEPEDDGIDGVDFVG